VAQQNFAAWFKRILTLNVKTKLCDLDQFSKKNSCILGVQNVCGEMVQALS